MASKVARGQIYVEILIAISLITTVILSLGSYLMKTKGHLQSNQLIIHQSPTRGFLWK